MMQDSNLKYYILVEGAKEGAAAFKLVGDAAKQAATAVSGTGTNAQGASKSIKDLNNTTNENANATNRAAKAQSNYFVHIAKTTVQSALVNKAFLSIVDAMGSAVKQADLIATFPASMAAIGSSSKDASDALVKLRQYVQGVGGDIGLATNAVARFVAVNKDVKASTAVFAGVNNALIAGGASAEAQAGALEQLVQAYSRGRFEGEEWKSVNTAMTLAISETAKALGYVSASGLQDALSEGKVSMNEFITELTKLSTEAGPIADQVALKMTGIEFAGTAMKNALVNGLTQIYMTVGRQNIVNFFTFLTDVITVLFQWVVQLINVFRWLFGLLTGNPMGDIAGDTAESLATGATAASDLGSNLDDAGKSAKKLRNQLAAFDKMNVLTEPAENESSDSGGGAGGLDPSQASALGDIFGDISGKMREASIWAKILGGLIASLAAYKAMSFVWSFLSPGLEKIALGIKGASREGGLMTKSLIGIGNGFGSLGASVAGFASRAGGVLSALAKNPFFLAGAVLLAIAGALVALYNTNEEFRAGFDSVWVPIVDTLSNIANVVFPAIAGAISKVGEVWEVIASGISSALGVIAPPLQQVWDVFAGWVASLFQINLDMQTFGTAIGIVAAALAGALLVQLGLTIARIIVMGVTWATTIATMAAQLAINAIRMAASWVIAMGPIGWIITAVVALVALIIANWDKIVEGFSAAWDWIVGIFSTVATWIYDNVIKPIGDFFAGLWQGLIDGLQAAWNWYVNLLITVALWIYNNVTKPIMDFFSGLWDGIVNVFKGVGKWFGDVFKGAWDGIKNAFSAVESFFRGIWDTIVGIFGKIGSSVGNAIGEAFKTVVNSIIGFAEGTINMFIRSINGAIGLINKIPGVNISTLTELKIPRLATGGVVNQPTIAEIGENGAEAVVPLENNLEWIDRLASRINGNGGSGQATPDIIPVTNAKEQPTTQISVNVSGVLATSEQDKRKLAEVIAKQLESQLRAKGLKGAF